MDENPYVYGDDFPGQTPVEQFQKMPEMPIIEPPELELPKTDTGKTSTFKESKIDAETVVREDIPNICIVECLNVANMHWREISQCDICMNDLMGSEFAFFCARCSRTFCQQCYQAMSINQA